VVEVKIESNVRETFEAISDEMTSTLARTLLKAANFTGGTIAEIIQTTFDNPSGALARSFLPARMVQVSGKGVGAGAISDLPYANIQDQGGTIEPKTRKYLTIPLSPEAKRQWARDWPEKTLFFLEAKATRNKFLAERSGAWWPPRRPGASVHRRS